MELSAAGGFCGLVGKVGDELFQQRALFFQSPVFGFELFDGHDLLGDFLIEGNDALLIGFPLQNLAGCSGFFRLGLFLSGSAPGTGGDNFAGFRIDLSNDAAGVAGLLFLRIPVAFGFIDIANAGFLVQEFDNGHGTSSRWFLHGNYER